MLNVISQAIFDDNYVWLIVLPETVAKASTAGTSQALVVDPGDAAPVLTALARWQLEPAAVLITHSHHDHIDGLPAFLQQWPVPVYAPAHSRIPEASPVVAEGDNFAICGVRFQVWALPGHLPEHVAFATEDDEGRWQVFSGDVLFSGGCGRIFDGSMTSLKHSLDRLNALPEDTLIYGTHEYTLANLAFAAVVEPENLAVASHRAQVECWRREGRPSLPTTLALERRINPFLRCDKANVRATVARRLGREPNDALEVFTELREWKNHFRAE